MFGQRCIFITLRLVDFCSVIKSIGKTTAATKHQADRAAHAPHLQCRLHHGVLQHPQKRLLMCTRLTRCMASLKELHARVVAA